MQPDPDDDALAARLQACLDERRDPLDDPELCDWLPNDPARLDDFVRLRASLRVLPRAAVHRRRPFVLAAAAVLTIGGAGALLLRQPATTSQSRILVAHWTETAPRAWLAAEVTARRQLVANDRTTLTTYERWSPRR